MLRSCNHVIESSQLIGRLHDHLTFSPINKLQMDNIALSLLLAVRCICCALGILDGALLALLKL